MAERGHETMSRRDRRVIAGVSVGLAALVFAPVLGRGFVLTYDMVFAPRQWLVPAALGLGTGLPRSVPADAVVAVATMVLPGDIVQKIALVLAMFFAAYGAARLVPTAALGTRIVAATAYGWTPYFAERLFIGHWPLLLTYACLPWIAHAGLSMRGNQPRALLRLALTMAPAALTPPGGLLAAGTALATAGWRRSGRVLAVSAVLNAPWWLPAVLHPAGTLSDPAGVAAFSARAETWAPPIVSVLGLGGIWNAEVVPGSLAGPLTPIVTILTVVVALAGLRMLARRWGTAPVVSVTVLGVTGVLLACLATLPLGEPVLTWSMTHVPGAGLVRDAQKWVAWWALPFALGFALALEFLTARLRTRSGRVGLVAMAAALPLVTMPDLAWGGWGRLETVHYPDDWRVVRHILLTHPRHGDVVSLPWGAYRSFAWNEGRTQLDPAPRVLPATTVIDDTLRVGDTEVAGEDPRLDRIRAATRARELSDLGIGWILVEHGTAQRVDENLVAGATRVWDGTWLSLYRTPGPVGPYSGPAPPALPVVIADIAVAALIAGAFLWYWLPAGKLAANRNARRGVQRG